MLCPADDSPLTVASVGGHLIHRCPQCLGAALSGTSLREVRAHAALQMHKQADSPGNQTCPADGKAMKPLNYKGVAMWACPQCLSLWLEAGQLSRLLELVQPHRPADLSKIGQHLGTMSDSSVFGNLDGAGDLLEFAAEILDGIGTIPDL